MSVVALSLSEGTVTAETAGTTDLHRAACQCDLRAMINAVQDGASVNGVDSDGHSPLHFAAGVRGEDSNSLLCVARSGAPEIAIRCRNAIDFLVHRGSDVNRANRWGETPLHFAAQDPFTQSRRTEVLVRRLLEHGADPNYANNKGNTPLHVANHYGHSRSVVAALIERGAIVDSTNSAGITPLQRAVRYGPDQMTVVDLLISRGADPDRKDADGDAPLHVAIKEGGNRGKAVVVDALLGGGADPCVRDAEGFTPYQISSGTIRHALANAGGLERSHPSGDGCPFHGHEGSSQEHEPLVKVLPIYPRRALARGIEGYVIVEFVITSTGLVTDPQIVEAEPPVIFDRAAIAAVLKSKYKPRIENGKAVDSRGVERVAFEFEEIDQTMEEVQGDVRLSGFCEAFHVSVNNEPYEINGTGVFTTVKHVVYFSPVFILRSVGDVDRYAHRDSLKKWFWGEAQRAHGGPLFDSSGGNGDVTTGTSDCTVYSADETHPDATRRIRQYEIESVEEPYTLPQGNAVELQSIPPDWNRR